MRFWVRFLKSIFKLAALPWLKKAQTKSLESVLLKSTGLLEPEMLGEMQSFIRLKLTKQGGFADRAGKCDLYYSLFGYYVAEAISVPDVKEPLKNYVKKTIAENTLSGVHLYCGAIHYAKLWGLDPISETLRKQIVTDLRKVNKQQSEYTNFLGILALYYLEDFLGIKRIVNQYKSISLPKEMPCPVIAATAILHEIAGKGGHGKDESRIGFAEVDGNVAECGYAAAPRVHEVQGDATDELSSSPSL